MVIQTHIIAKGQYTHLSVRLILLLQNDASQKKSTDKRCSHWTENPRKFVNYAVTRMDSNSSQFNSPFIIPSIRKHWD
jgi:hypothetical protein